MLKVYHIRHDFFIIQTEDFDIIFDPYQTKQEDLSILDDNTPTYTFLTHEHFDHYNVQDLHLITSINHRANQYLIFPQTMLPKLTTENALDLYLAPTQIKEVQPNNEYKLNNLKFYTIPAYNVNKFRQDNVPYHPKENKWVGYIIELPKDYLPTDVVINAKYYKNITNLSIKTIMHTGDSDNIPEYKNLPVQVDLLLVPVSGTYVMTDQEACEATKIIHPQLVIPMHYGSLVGDDTNAQNFLKCISQ